MKKRVKKIALVVLLILLLFIVFVSIVYHKNLSVLHKVNTYIPARKLHFQSIVPILEYVTNLEIEFKMHGAKGIFEGGRDPSIFVCFNGDANEVKSFFKRNATEKNNKTVNKQYLDFIKASNYSLFFRVKIWEERLNTKYFNQDSLGEGELLEFHIEKNRNIKVLFDNDNNMIYIFAWFE